MKSFIKGAAAASLIGGAALIYIIATSFLDSPQATSDLFFSEYIEGSSFNKAVEIYNGTGSTVDLSNYSVELYSNGSATVSQSVALSGSLADGDVFVMAHGNADAAILAEADMTSSSVINFNGDDALVLRSTSVVDVIGQVGFDPGTEWGTGNTSTADNTIRRLASVCVGDTNPDDVFDPSIEWEGFATNTFDGLGSHTADCGSVTPVVNVVINEIIQNPAAVLDAAGEWFELYNAGSDPVDIDGWTIADNDSDSHVINNGGPLIIPAGGYIVLGNNADSSTNGGVPVSYSYGGSWFLANSADEVVLMDAELNEIDRVEYGVGFPNPTGASMALISPELDNNVGSNWCESTTPFGDGDLGTPGSANTCDIVTPAPEIVINEIIQNPAAVADASGEWFELYNAGSDPVDISGWTIADNGSDSHVINNGGPLTIPVGGYIVLGNNADSSTNGGVTVDYQYSGFTLANGDDEVVLTDASLNEIDRVEYDGGPNFPDPTGASMALISPELDNNVGSNWCESTTPFGDGDLGTPGSANDCVTVAPEIVINEIMPDPSAVTDANGEWFELYNAGSDPVDIDGWTIADNGSDSHVINNGGPLTIPAGGYLVLGNNTNSGTNGGVTVSYSYGGSWFLANGDDEIILLDASLNEIDRVEYDGGVTFPDPTGASMALISPTLDNNVGANWCESTTPFGSGDLGTPGGPNDCAGSLVYINEMRVSLTGSPDADFFEIQGAPGTDLTGLTYLAISGEFSPGGIDYAISLDGASIPADGLFVAGGSDTASLYGITPDLATEFDFFGSPQTHLIVSGFTGNAGDDLDTNNDGVLDVIPWTGILDSVALIDGDGVTDYSYSPVVVGPDGDFLPAGAFRCPDAPAGVFGSNILSFSDLDGTPGDLNDCGGGASDVGVCGASATLIHDIQGAGMVSLFNNVNNVIIEGVVIADYQTGDLNGFYVQEEDSDADADPLTSEGIFVFEGASAVDVNVGDVVRLIGDVTEFFNLTEITNLGGVIVCDQPGTVTASIVPMPFPAPVGGVEFLERYEGMLVTFDQDLYVTELFNLDRGGMITLSSGARLDQPTNIALPGAPANAIQAANDLNHIFLDDGSRTQNPIPIIHPSPALSPTNTIRGGDIVRDIVGVLTFSNAGWTGSGGDDAYRVHPLATPTYVHVNPRPAGPPAVGGNITVASFNVLNFFNGDGQGGGFPTSRGATTFSDFQRQRDNLITAVIGLDADVIGLIEIENDGFGAFSAIQDLVNGLNDVAGAGTYAFVDPGVSQVGTDEIMVALIYNATVVQETGVASILDTPANVFQGVNTNRAILAQTFTVIDGLNPGFGESFTIAVNHFKSKGQSGLSCPTPAADPNCDQGDGQGYWTARRVEAANALVAWLGTDPTGSSDPDFLIIGDLNGYEMEDPVTTITGAGYTNLAAGDYSYVFDGQWGALDHALANPSLTAQVTGAAHWHINADEPDALDYSSLFNDPSLYANDGFRASDHDPVVIGFDLAPPPGDITIIKSASPNTDAIFTFNNNAFGLADDGSTTFTDLAPGDYDFTEDEAEGWELVNIDCGGASVTPIASGVTIALGADESVTCTFYNEDINDPPFAMNDTYTINEDTPTLLSVLDNDNDDDGDGLTIISVENFDNGLPQIQGTQILFTPALNFYGAASFTYTISDGELTDTALVEIEVLPVNDPPVAINDSAVTDEDTPVVIDVKVNDSDPDGDTTTIIIISNATNGNVTTDGATATYTPNAGFSGVDTFTYALLDPSVAQSNTATVTVTVNPNLCASPNPRADLTGTLISDNMGMVTNGSSVCSYEIGMASYRKFDEVIDHQIIYDYTDPTVIIEPGQTIQLQVAVPDCAAQVDLFWGPVLLSLNSQRYGQRLLDAHMIGGTDYCTETDPYPRPEQQQTGQPAAVVALEPVAAPPLAPCAVEDNRAGSIFRVQIVGEGISSSEAICRVVAENGAMYHPGAVGDQSVVDQGVIHAVDVFGVDPSVTGAIQVCLQGAGGVIYLDANLSPRVPEWMPTTPQNGYTCVVIPHAGMVVLTQNNGYVGAAPDAISDVSSQTLPLGTCRVTTTNMVNLREEPSTSGAFITLLPYNLTLDATERSGSWIRVVYLDGQGWVHSDYLIEHGDCGG